MMDLCLTKAGLLTYSDMLVVRAYQSKYSMTRI